MDRDEILIEILKQNFEHARHVENERLWFTNVYALIVGAMLTFISREERLFLISMMFLLFLSILGLLVSLRLRADYSDYLCKIVNISTELKVREVTGIGAERGVTIYFKLRSIFPIFYAFMSIFFTIIIVLYLYFPTCN